MIMETMLVDCWVMRSAVGLGDIYYRLMIDLILLECSMLTAIPLLLSTVVPDVAGTANNLTEEKISDKCFELMFAFDEVSQSGILSLLR
jgi:hypothetical protein